MSIGCVERLFRAKYLSTAYKATSALELEEKTFSAREEPSPPVKLCSVSPKTVPFPFAPPPSVVP